MKKPDPIRETLLWALARAKERLLLAANANQLHPGDGDTGGPFIAMQTYERSLDQLP